MTNSERIPNKAVAIDRLRLGEVRLPPLSFTLIETPAITGSSVDDCDALIEAAWGLNRYHFALRYRTRSTPKVFAETLAGLRKLRLTANTYPMLMVPYLPPQHLAELETAGISGIDLCGNGVVVAPRQMYIVRTGQPNRYPQSDPIKNIYRGSSSIVPRVFLARACFTTLREIAAEIEARRGRIALSTISKAVSTLDQDLIVRKTKRETHLLQPEALLERLAANYRPPRVDRRLSGECDMDTATIFGLLSAGARKLRFRCTASGLTSLGRYATMAREQKTQLYCSNLSEALALLRPRIRETSRFANVELLETAEECVYFDTRVEDGIPWASPAQAFLELMAGDKRDRETAEQVRDRILEELRSQETE